MCREYPSLGTIRFLRLSLLNSVIGQELRTENMSSLLDEVGDGLVGKVAFE